MNACLFRGFTLIEVMVALAVLAIALASAISAVRSAAANSAHLYDVIFSHWAAHDAAMRIKLAPPDPARFIAGIVTQTLYGRPYRVSTIYVPDAANDFVSTGEFRITVTLPGAVEGEILGESKVRFDVRDK